MTHVGSSRASVVAEPPGSVSEKPFSPCLSAMEAEISQTASGNATVEKGSLETAVGSPVSRILAVPRALFRFLLLLLGTILLWD